jgi:type II secretory pathway component PulM
VLQWGAVAAAVLLLLALLLPLRGAVNGARTRVEAKQQDLEWLQRVAPSLASAGPMAAPPTSQESLVVLLDTSARESGLSQALSGSQPSAGGHRLTFQKADFNLLVAWLARLTQQHGLRIESGSFEASADPGIVNAVVVIHLR